MQETLLDATNFAIRFGPSQAERGCVARLHALVASVPVAEGFEEQAEWLEDLAGWLFERGRAPGAQPGELRPTARLRLLLTVLDEMPEQKEQVRACLAAIFAGLNYVRLFTDTGLPSESGFVAESWRRLMKSLLPEPPVEKDAATLLHRLFRDARSSEWFDSISPELRGRLFTLLEGPSGHAFEPTLDAMRDATVLLAIRVAEAGTSDAVRERCPDPSLARSPFLQLPLLVRSLVGAAGAPSPSDGDPGVAVREGIAACRKVLRAVLSSLDRTGISLKLVFRLELLRQLLDRLYLVLTLLAPPSGTRVEGAVARLLQTLIRGGVRDRSLLELARTNSRLLARRVIERAGRTGERYITRTRAEQHQMVSSAAGGGAIVGVAVLAKFLIGWAHLPVLLETLAIGLNYSAAFVSMQLCHFTLATKQPSMTAAALAHSIKMTGDTPDVGPLVDQVVRTVRSQFAAFVGNLGVVGTVPVLLDLLWQALFEHHLLDAAKADRIIANHHPIFSGTLLFAAFTGVYLWASSIVAGTVENWFVVEQLPDALRTSRTLRGLVGKARAHAFSVWCTNNVAGLAGNVSFGFMLALVPMLVGLWGIPLEVRHITFVMGQLVFAGMQRGAIGVLEPDYLWAFSSIGLVGLINFSVSFGLSLGVALRAREVQTTDQAQLIVGVLRRLKQRPLDFIRAPVSEPTDAVTTATDEPLDAPEGAR